MLKLNRQVVADRYECTATEDFIVHIGCYNGPLSNINECGAAALVKSGVSYLVEKPQEEDTTP
ncbi:hypothetical protein SAMN05444008_11562 [Cnuella takakiae]|uniref:Uncharacterized protein n=1 Tax=Cnuella takakiae TaxID=1302690 RepID=A0A1M5G1L8_9BACT|nr:hypothetical protein [Cnuella takakiae]OLY92296.1 hypothetical protein BUE76_10620 [Cnuella takakiae]SHF97596.1 hypothetical protein SAMN05444008_11562 [Cnuella takakiae]